MRVVSAVIAVLGFAWLAVVWRSSAHATTGIGITVPLVGGAAIAAVIFDGARTRLALVQLLLLGVAVFAGLRVTGHWPFDSDNFGAKSYAAFIAAVALASIVGLHARALWARWVVAAFSVAGAIGGAMNAYICHSFADDSPYLAGLGAFGCTVVLAQLAAPNVRALFYRPDHAVWTSRDPIVRLARVAAIAAIAAVPMLLVYALAQPLTPETRPTALALAPLLAIGATLVLRQKTIGLVVIGLGSIGLLAQSWATAAWVDGYTSQLVPYYLAFWVPAAALGINAMMAAVWRGISSSAASRAS